MVKIAEFSSATRTNKDRRTAWSFWSRHYSPHSSQAYSVAEKKRQARLRRAQALHLKLRAKMAEDYPDEAA